MPDQTITLKIDLETNTSAMIETLKKINDLTYQLGRAVRDLEILQKQQNSATVRQDDDAVQITD